MPTTLPARRPLDAEHQALADRLALIGRLAEAARQDRRITLPRLLYARLDLWLIGFRLQRLRQQQEQQQRRHPDRPE